MTNPDPLPGDEDLEDVMSELKATPGPWIFCDGDFDYSEGNEGAIGSVRSDEVDGWYIARIEDADGFAGTATANAHLIAAAPELYEALTEVMSWIDGWEPQFVEDDGWADTEEKVEAAIKKARGEQ